LTFFCAQSFLLPFFVGSGDVDMELGIVYTCVYTCVYKKSGASPMITSCNASVLKIYNGTYSILSAFLE
jgi:hypothetical protein